jgi:hypothetical protein
MMKKVAAVVKGRAFPHLRLPAASLVKARGEMQLVAEGAQPRLASPRSFHAPSPLHDCRCGTSSGDQSSSSIPKKVRNSIRQRQLRASRTSRMRESVSKWRTSGDNSETEL